MLEGKNFVIMSDTEIALLYEAFRTKYSLASVRELQSLGILSIIQDIEKHLYPVDTNEANE